jgi:chitodextrinase
VYTGTERITDTSFHSIQLSNYMSGAGRATSYWLDDLIVADTFIPMGSTPPPTDTTPPSTPTALTATAASASQINLSWSASTDAVGVTGYKVYRAGTQIATTTTTTYQNTGLTASTAYTYTVSAYDAAGNTSAQTAGVSATTQATTDTTAPTTPTNLTLVPFSDAQINLSWTASTDAVGVTGYRVERCQGTTCTTFAYIATSTTNSYVNTGLAASTAYRYRVRATDAAGNNSAYSTRVSTTTKATPPPADTTPPTLSSVSVGSITTTGATISWNTNENADTQVEYGLTTSYGQSTTLNSTLTTTHSQSLTALSSGTLYHYRVKSKDAAGNLAQSSDLTFTTLTPPDTTPPTTPTAFTATPISTTQVNLTWSASTDNVGVTGYRIERCTGVSCTSYIQIVSIGTSSLAYTDTGLTANTSYGYRVRAVDAAGNLSPYSTPASVTTQSVVVSDTTPPSLSAVTVSGSASSLTWTWTTNELADTKVVYGTSSNVLTTTLTNSTLLTSHTLTTTNLIRRTTYYYQVISKDAAGNTSTSTTGSFLTAAGRTAPITNLQAANGSVILTWNRTNDPFATSLVIYRSTSGFPTASSTTALSATITDLSATT